MFAVALSCTVLEDRVDCKSYAVLDVEYDRTRLPESAFDLYIWKDGSFLRREKMPISLKNHKYDLALEAGEYEFLGISCLSDERKSEDGTRVLLDEKGQYTEFYAFKERVYIGEEDVEVKTALSKQFVRLVIRLHNVPYKTYSVSIEGELRGVGLRTLEPIDGVFRYDWPNNSSIYNITLSRQLADSHLFLRVQNNGGTMLEDFESDIMEFIRKENYRWDAEELLDIDVSIDIINRLTIVQFKH